METMSNNLSAKARARRLIAIAVMTHRRTQPDLKHCKLPLPTPSEINALFANTDRRLARALHAA